jgi:hypothetical protein
MIISTIDKYISNKALRFAKRPLYQSISIFLYGIVLIISSLFYITGLLDKIQDEDLFGSITFAIIAGFTVPLIITSLLYILLLLAKKISRKSITGQILIPTIFLTVVMAHSSWEKCLVIFCSEIIVFFAYYEQKGAKGAFWRMTLVFSINTWTYVLVYIISHCR